MVNLRQLIEVTQIRGILLIFDSWVANDLTLMSSNHAWKTLINTYMSANTKAAKVTEFDAKSAGIIFTHSS